MAASKRLSAVSSLPEDGPAVITEGRSAARDVARHLRINIQAGALLPGTWLREIKLAEELGASRSAVREALRLLERDGLVELEKFRGARIAAPSLFEIFDLFEVRAALFGLVARFAVFRASDGDIAEIVRRIHQLLSAANTLTPEERVDEGVEIGALIALHGSREARELMAASHRKARWYLSYWGLAESRGSYGPLERWEGLATALAERDPEAAADNARRIIYYMQQEVTRVLVARGATST